MFRTPRILCLALLACAALTTACTKQPPEAETVTYDLRNALRRHKAVQMAAAFGSLESVDKWDFGQKIDLSGLEFVFNSPRVLGSKVEGDRATVRVELPVSRGGVLPKGEVKFDLVFRYARMDTGWVLDGIEPDPSKLPISN